jgi:hypothetical protein
MPTLSQHGGLPIVVVHYRELLFSPAAGALLWLPAVDGVVVVVAVVVPYCSMKRVPAGYI